MNFDEALYNDCIKTLTRRLTLSEFKNAFATGVKSLGFEYYFINYGPLLSEVNRWNAVHELTDFPEKFMTEYHEYGLAINDTSVDIVEGALGNISFWADLDKEDLISVRNKKADMRNGRQRLVKLYCEHNLQNGIIVTPETPFPDYTFGIDYTATGNIKEELFREHVSVHKSLIQTLTNLAQNTFPAAERTIEKLNLTEQEIQFLEFDASDKKSEEIARVWGVSVNRVYKFRSALKQKLLPFDHIDNNKINLPRLARSLRFAPE